MSTLTKKELLPNWLEKLPPIAPPITLGEDTHLAFSRYNSPLPQSLIDTFILPYEFSLEEDAFNEYIPCFRLGQLKPNHACVYWRASLMTYVYVLATYTPEGEQIDRAIIAGSFMMDGKLVQRVAHIGADLTVTYTEGRSSLDAKELDLKDTVQTILKINPNGKLSYETPSGH